MLFPGAHCDVGGGYPSTNNESGLSDAALEWMSAELAAVGAKLSGKAFPGVSPNAGAKAHEPWKHTLYKQNPREIVPPIVGHHSIALREMLPAVYADPQAEPAPYRPTDRPAVICDWGPGASPAQAKSLSPCVQCAFQK